MKRLPILAVITSLAASPAMAESQTFDVPPFQFVSVSEGITAIISIGAEQSVLAEAPSASELSRLDLKVTDNRLELGTDWNLLDLLFRRRPHPTILVRVMVPRLLGVDASSAANVDAKGVTAQHLSFEASSGAALVASQVSGTVIKLKSSSGASIEASGSCTDLTADASSGASVTAPELRCSHLDASASSSGHVTAYAAVSVEAEGSSGGSVNVLGNPETVSRQASSGGSVNIGQ